MWETKPRALPENGPNDDEDEDDVQSTAAITDECSVTFEDLCNEELVETGSSGEVYTIKVELTYVSADRSNMAWQVQMVGRAPKMGL